MWPIFFFLCQCDVGLEASPAARFVNTGGAYYHEFFAACERRARIPIASESLNAAMAATVALYEMTRRGGRDIYKVPTS